MMPGSFSTQPAFVSGIIPAMQNTVNAGDISLGWHQKLAQITLNSVYLEVNVQRELSQRRPICTVVRGLLGERFRDLRCLTGAELCNGCGEKANCAFDQIFGSDEDQETGPRFHWIQGVPAHREAMQGDRWAASLMVIGKAQAHLPFLQVAFQEGIRRLGGSRYSPAESRAGDDSRLVPAVRTGPANWRTFSLVSPSASPSKRWLFRTLTPVVLRNDLHKDNVRRDTESCPAEPLLPLLLRLVIRRLRTIWESAGDGSAFVDPPRVDLRSVRSIHRRVTRWSAERMSGRQHQIMPMDGIEFEFEVEGDVLYTLSPLLHLIPVLNVGRMTTMGLGQIDTRI